MALPASAQDTADTTVVAAEDPPTTNDVRLLHAIYGIESPGFAAAMEGANWSSYKVFIGAAPALWLGTLVLDDAHDYEPAFLLTLTEASTIGLVVALKNVIQRPRPYTSLSTITSRSPRYRKDATFDPYSFPSGHAATSFAIATSLSLSYPAWYVIAPSALWAVAVTVSRPWLGVHYPTDVAVGAALGVGVAFGVHALGELIVPDSLSGDGGDDPLRAPSEARFVRFVVPL